MESKKCLFVKIGALGDIFFCLPHLFGAKQQLQLHSLNLEWDFLTGDVYTDLIQRMPFIHKVFSISYKNLYSKNWLKRILTLFYLHRSLSPDLKSYDKIIVAHRSVFYSILFSFWTRKRIYQLRRLEVPNPSLWNSITNWILSLVSIPYYVQPLTLHESLIIKNWLEIIFSISLKNSFFNPQQFSFLDDPSLKKMEEKTSLNPNSKQEKNFLEWKNEVPGEKLHAQTKFDYDLVMHIGGGVNAGNEFRLKQWPYFQKLLQLIIQRTSWKIALVGNHLEKEEIQKEIIEMPSERVVSLAGQFTLVELVSFIKNSPRFIGGDSGPLHIAETFQVPCIGLYGPTSDISWGLRSQNSKALKSTQELSCRPCYKDDGHFPDCTHQHLCLRELSVELVFQNLLNLTKSDN